MLPLTLARWLCGITATIAMAGAIAAPAYQAIPATGFVSVLATEKDAAPVSLAAFAMREEPVTNAEFLAFVAAHPQWRRDAVPTVFTDARYLAHWSAPEQLGAAALPDQPVTQVSWFAARAYCESEQARLPTWLEWERTAAASADTDDARGDPAWRRKLLDWYAQPSSRGLGSIGGEANLYGVRDLHALVWEWVDDYSALIVAPDSRDQGDPDRMKFCGEAALSLRDRDNYALLMRVAMLSSLKAANTTVNLGFRCARDLP
ncbi:formylglycine-generating enzyme family protein [Dokdonella sp.]|uniref:formylglycine-generating enzyme family protein n=1 Tax=Dokdonella sp. TaxID=2291710 RepID=UPI0031C8E24B|nr:formylglycine-generating enzyme family protein [Dokdonella sp.]